MFIQLSRHWWWLALRGFIAIVFGALALIWPQREMLSLVLAFGAFALVDVFFTLIWGLVSMGSYDRGWAIRWGLGASIIIGLFAVFWPGKTAVILMYSIAAWAIIAGALEIMAARPLRRVLTSRQTLFVYGILSVVFGILLFVNLNTGALSLVWVIGYCTIAMGITLIILGFGLRGPQRHIRQPVHRAPEVT
jgi:uncharacterized membrane protein HdeD (DUF308 family)